MQDLTRGNITVLPICCLHIQQATLIKSFFIAHRSWELHVYCCLDQLVCLELWYFNIFICLNRQVLFTRPSCLVCNKYHFNVIIYFTFVAILHFGAYYIKFASLSIWIALIQIFAGKYLACSCHIFLTSPGTVSVFGCFTKNQSSTDLKLSLGSYWTGSDILTEAKEVIYRHFSS